MISDAAFRFLDFEAIRVDLAAGNKRQLLNQLAQIAAGRLSLDPSQIADAIAERERLGSTGFGGGVAIPHGKLDKLDRIYAWSHGCPRQIDYKAIDGRPGRPRVPAAVSARTPVRSISRRLPAVSRLVRHGGIVEKLRGARSRDAMAAVLNWRRGAGCSLRSEFSGEEAHLRALEVLYNSAPINQLFQSTLVLPQAGRSEIRFRRDARYIPRGRAAHGTLYFKMLDDAAFYACQWPGQRPIPVDHRLQPALHKPMRSGEARGRGARGFPGKRRGFRGRSANCRREGEEVRTRHRERSCARTSP
jgi:PTS system nitrogen regulatory IIA component